MQAGLWSAAALAALIAVFSGWRDWRRRRRHDPDAVGVVDWPTVQMLALIALMILASMALNA